MVKYEQLKEYMIDKTKVILRDDVNEKLKNVKMIHGFESDSHTLAYLIDMENELRSKQMIKKTATCELCDKILELNEFKIPRKCTHWHVDRSSCHGKLCKISYNIVTGTNDKKDERSGTNDKKDKSSGTIDTKTKEKIEAEEWENSPINPKNYKMDPD